MLNETEREEFWDIARRCAWAVSIGRNYMHALQRVNPEIYLKVLNTEDDITDMRAYETLRLKKWVEKYIG